MPDIPQCVETFKGPFTRTVSVPISVTVTVNFTLTEKMGSEPNVSVKRSVSIGTMLNFDGDTDGHGDGMCKQTLTSSE